MSPQATVIKVYSVHMLDIIDHCNWVVLLCIEILNVFQNANASEQYYSCLLIDSGIIVFCELWFGVVLTSSIWLSAFISCCYPIIRIPFFLCTIFSLLIFPHQNRFYHTVVHYTSDVLGPIGPVTSAVVIQIMYVPPYTSTNPLLATLSPTLLL